MLRILFFGISAFCLLYSFQTFADLTSEGTVTMPLPHKSNSTSNTMPMSGAKIAPNALVNHGGPLLQNSHTYAIYWGDPSEFPSDLAAGMDDFFNGFNGSDYADILNQYFKGPGTSQFYNQNVIDTSNIPNPARPLSRAQVVAEVCKEIKSDQLPLDPVVRSTSSGGVYFVFTSAFPNNPNFCAWHSYGSCRGKKIAVSYVPNLSASPLCDPGDMNETSTYSAGTRLFGTVVAHELAEAITDPLLNAWHLPHVSEVGDLCAWQFQNTVKLTSGTLWQLQELWSNSAMSCVQD